MDLITLQEYKDFYMEGTLNTSEDSKISFLISSVSALIQAYIGTDFEGNKTVEEIISVDYSTNKIYLDNHPVSSILEITETDRYTIDSTVHVPLVYSSDYLLNPDEGSITRVFRVGGFANWPISPGMVRITYVTAPKFNIIGGVPMDLKMAALEMVKYYKDEEYRQSKTIQSSSLVNTLAQDGDFPKHIQVILDRYK